MKMVSFSQLLGAHHLSSAFVLCILWCFRAFVSGKFGSSASFLRCASPCLSGGSVLSFQHSCTLCKDLHGGSSYSWFDHTFPVFKCTVSVYVLGWFFPFLAFAYSVCRWHFFMEGLGISTPRWREVGPGPGQLDSSLRSTCDVSTDAFVLFSRCLHPVSRRGIQSPLKEPIINSELLETSGSTLLLSCPRSGALLLPCGLHFYCWKQRIRLCL